MSFGIVSYCSLRHAAKYSRARRRLFTLALAVLHLYPDISNRVLSIYPAIERTKVRQLAPSKCFVPNDKLSITTHKPEAVPEDLLFLGVSGFITALFITDSEPGQRSVNRLRPSTIYGHHLRDGLSGAVDALRTPRNPRNSRATRPRCRKGCAVNQSSCRPLYPNQAELDLRTTKRGAKGETRTQDLKERKVLTDGARIGRGRTGQERPQPFILGVRKERQ